MRFKKYLNFGSFIIQHKNYPSLLATQGTLGFGLKIFYWIFGLIIFKPK